MVKDLFYGVLLSTLTGSSVVCAFDPNAVKAAQEVIQTYEYRNAMLNTLNQKDPKMAAHFVEMEKQLKEARSSARRCHYVSVGGTLASVVTVGALLKLLGAMFHR